VPMQFLILLIGALLFTFYLLFQSPVFFNQKQIDKVYASGCDTCAMKLREVERVHDSLCVVGASQTKLLIVAQQNNAPTSNLQLALQHTESLKKEKRKEAIALIKQADKTADVNDTNYIFLYFVVHHLPKGLVGLLIAVIFLAAWGSIAAALNSLCSSTIIDLYKRVWVKNESDTHYYNMSKWITLFWGIFCIATAMFASQLGSLIEAVNVLGSIFYGPMLGIFVVAFYMKKIGGREVFYAALLSQVTVIAVYWADVISFLWLNVIGCVVVMGAGALLHLFNRQERLTD